MSEVAQKTVEKMTDKETFENEIVYRIRKRYGRTIGNAVRTLGKENKYEIAKIAQLLFAAFCDTHMWIEDKTECIASLRLYRQSLSEQIYSEKIWENDPFVAVDAIACNRAAREAEEVLKKKGL
jgi:hypothetical protein